MNEQAFIQYALRRPGAPAETGLRQSAAAGRLTAAERRQVAISLRAARGAAAQANQLSRRLPRSSPAAGSASIQIAAAAVEASAAQQDFDALNAGLVELERSLRSAAFAPAGASTRVELLRDALVAARAAATASETEEQRRQAEAEIARLEAELARGREMQELQTLMHQQQQTLRAFKVPVAGKSPPPGNTKGNNMSWKLKLLPAGLLAALGTLASTQPAAAWDVVGQQEFYMAGGDYGVYGMTLVNGHRQYRQIKLCVYRNPVYFRDLRINFRNGGHQDVSIRSRINADECTRVIDLEGRARDINIRARDINISTLTDEKGDAGAETILVRVYAQ